MNEIINHTLKDNACFTEFYRKNLQKNANLIKIEEFFI